MNRVEYFKKMLTVGLQDWGARPVPGDERVVVSKEDLLAMLSATANEHLTLDELRDWANLVLFNDAFDYNGDDLRDVLDRIEESDEPGCELDASELAEFVRELGDSK